MIKRTKKTINQKKIKKTRRKKKKKRIRRKQLHQKWNEFVLLFD